MKRRAFTLVELLVVIVIIGILASLVSVAVVRALDTARQTRMKVEVDSLDAALKAYKEKYGSYPPCDLRKGGVNEQLVKSHVARVFPRYYDISKAVDDIRKVVDPDNTGDFRPDLALVFWLNGFNPDPTTPFKDLDGMTPLTKAQRTEAIFSFDPARFHPQIAGKPNAYYPTGSNTKTPYVYFDADCVKNFGYTPLLTYDTDKLTGASTGIAFPFFLDQNGNGAFDANEDLANADSFQVIAPGTDNQIGVKTSVALSIKKLYPTGTNYDPAELDNVTNFCSKARLEDARP